MGITRYALNKMYTTAGLKKRELHNALRTMGTKFLKPEYREAWSSKRPTTGYCYTVCELVYHYLAPEGTKPHVINLDSGGTHWFLKYPDSTIVDLTADQFDTKIDYSLGRPQSFIGVGKKGSKRAQKLAEILGLSVP